MLGSHEADKHFLRVSEDWMGWSGPKGLMAGTRHIVPPSAITAPGDHDQRAFVPVLRAMADQRGAVGQRGRLLADVRARLNH